MSPIQIAIVTSDASIAEVVRHASLACGAEFDIDVYSNDLKYLQSTPSYDLSFVDPDDFSLVYHGSTLVKRQWVYLAKSNLVPIDVLEYQPILGCNVFDVEVFNVKVNNLLRVILKENNCLEVVQDSPTIGVKRVNGNMLRVEIDKVIYCRTNGDFVDIHLCEGGGDIVKVTVQERMKTLVAILSGRGFIQVHRLWLVNVNSGIENHPYPKDGILLQCGLTIPLARRRKLSFLTAYRAR